MAKIAVDVALLPSEEMMDKAIDANRDLLKQHPDKIVLVQTDSEPPLLPREAGALGVPHISLAMGCIDEKDIAEIEKVLEAIAEQHSLGKLIVVGITVSTNSVGEKVSSFQIERTETIQLLHEEVMRTLRPYFSYDATVETVLTPPQVSESTLLWIKNYPEKSSFEKFFPHITLGYGQIKVGAVREPPLRTRGVGCFPIKFTVSKLALCHLGNHCTCRKILAATELKS